MTRSRIWLKYFDEVIIELPSGEIVEGGQAKDGLVYELPASAEVCKVLNLCYTTRDAHGWYFNNTRDRYVAEIEVDHILVNPRFIAQHCTVA